MCCKGFFSQNNIHVIKWPSNNPDLNPIDNMWKIIKTNVEKRMPKDIGELKQFMIEEQDKIPQDVIQNLIRSMKNRCKLVLQKNGDRISY